MVGKSRKNGLKQRKTDLFWQERAALLHYGNNRAQTFRLRQN